MRTLQDLSAHMNKYKDAVFVIGPGLLTEKESYATDEYNECYTRKNLVRNPEVFWDFVQKHMLGEPSNIDIAAYEAVEMAADVASLFINQNTVGTLSEKMVHLHGLKAVYSCHKCKTQYPSAYIKSKEPYENQCECCGGTLRPTALLSGERYDKSSYDRIVSAFESTHTVVLVGMDYTEEFLMDMVSQFGDIKSFTNEKGEEERMLVAIQPTEETFDPNEMAFCEFLVRDNVVDAVGRLCNAL